MISISEGLSLRNSYFYHYVMMNSFNLKMGSVRFLIFFIEQLY